MRRATSFGVLFSSELFLERSSLLSRLIVEHVGGSHSRRNITKSKQPSLSLRRWTRCRTCVEEREILLGILWPVVVRHPCGLQRVRVEFVLLLGGFMDESESEHEDGRARLRSRRVTPFGILISFGPFLLMIDRFKVGSQVGGRGRIVGGMSSRVSHPSLRRRRRPRCRSCVEERGILLRYSDLLLLRYPRGLQMVRMDSGFSLACALLHCLSDLHFFTLGYQCLTGIQRRKGTGSGRGCIGSKGGEAPHTWCSLLERP